MVYNLIIGCTHGLHSYAGRAGPVAVGPSPLLSRRTVRQTISTPASWNGKGEEGDRGGVNKIVVKDEAGR